LAVMFTFSPNSRRVSSSSIRDAYPLRSRVFAGLEVVHVSKDFKKGDRVRWDAGNQSSVGTVEEKITKDTHAGKRDVKASPEDPQYLVKSEKSGKTAVHHPDKLHKA
jgi:hypothetical protein